LGPDVAFWVYKVIDAEWEAHGVSSFRLFMFIGPDESGPAFSGLMESSPYIWVVPTCFLGGFGVYV